MAGNSSRIKGIVVEIGGDVTGLTKALSGVNKQIGNTQRQLKDVEKLLKMDPGNTELLEQKYNLLARAVEETEEKLDALKEAEKQVQEQFKRGDVSEDQYNSLRREIIATENNLQQLKDQAKSTQKALDGVDEKPVEQVADAAEKAEKALDDAGKEASSFGDYLKAEAIVEGVKGIGSAISDLTEETKEYQRIMASIETSSKRAGYTAEETEDIYRKLYGVLGDDQTAATTTANLQALGLEQRELMRIADAAIGAWAAYGDSIPIDGLAESINETIRSGQVTGTFADVLNWGSKAGETFGVTLKKNTKANEEWNKSVEACETAEDYFNLALQEASTEVERQNLVMEAFANQGLTAAGKEWQENNEAILEANEAQAEFTKAASELSERVTPVITAVQEGFNDILSSVLELTEDVNFEKIASGISEGFEYFTETVIPIATDFFDYLIEHGDEVAIILAAIAGGFLGLKLSAVAGQLGAVLSGAASLTEAFPLLGGAIGILTNPVFLVSAAVVGLVALIAAKGDEIQEILQGVDDFLQGVFLIDWTQVFGAGLGDALNGFFANLKNIWDSVKKILDGIIDFIRGVFTGDWERAWKGIESIFGGIFGGLKAIAKAPLNGIISLINGLVNGVNWVIDKINGISIDIPDWMGGGHIGFSLDRLANIPYLAKGGVLTKGSAIVGEAGPELLTLAGGQAVVQPLTNQTTNNSTNLGGINITVYGAPGQDVNELAEIISEKISDSTARLGEVYA